MKIELDVCPGCGWHAHTGPRSADCAPALGRAATRLQEAAPDVSSTKLGYGHGRVTFEIDDDLSVGFDVRHPWNATGDARDESTVTFPWQRLHSLGGLSHDDALDLVRTLRDWSVRRRDREGAATR